MYSLFSRCLVLTCAITLVAPVLTRAADPTYWQDIRPVLRKSCTVCHNPRQLKEPEISGGLALDTYEAVLKWKEKKRTLVHAGKSGESLLYRVIVTNDSERRMPLGAKPLATEQIELLKRWIDSGAKEGVRPESTPVTPPRIVRTRKLDVNLATTTTPPAGAFKGVGRGPMALSLRVGPLAPVPALAFHPGTKDGKLPPMLAAGAYGRVTLWDIRTGKPVKVLTSVLGAVNDLKFSPDGTLLAVAGGQPSAKGDLRLFRVADWKLQAVLPGHDDVVGNVAFRPDGKKLASASYDKTARVWDVASHKLDRTFTHHSDFVTCVDWSPDGKYLFTGSKDRSVRMLDAVNGASKFTYSDRDEDVLALAVHPDGKSVVVTGMQPALTWWSTETGARIRNVAGHRGAVNELAFTGSGKLLASAGSDGTVKVFNGTSGAVQRSITVGSLVYSTAVSADGKLVAAGCFDGMVRLYDAATGNLRAGFLSLPPVGEREDWLTMTAAGYTIGNDELLTTGRWNVAGKPIPGEVVWKTLRKPDVVARALQGTPPPTPAFGK